jgi:hypothetical protein
MATAKHKNQTRPQISIAAAAQSSTVLCAPPPKPLTPNSRPRRTQSSASLLQHMTPPRASPQIARPQIRRLPIPSPVPASASIPVRHPPQHPGVHLRPRPSRGIDLRPWPLHPPPDSSPVRSPPSVAAILLGAPGGGSGLVQIHGCRQAPSVAAPPHPCPRRAQEHSKIGIETPHLCVLLKL